MELLIYYYVSRINFVKLHIIIFQIQIFIKNGIRLNILQTESKSAALSCQWFYTGKARRLKHNDIMSLSSDQN